MSYVFDNAKSGSSLNGKTRREQIMGIHRTSFGTFANWKRMSKICLRYAMHTSCGKVTSSSTAIGG